MDLEEAPKGKLKDLSPLFITPLAILLEESSAEPEGGGVREREPDATRATNGQREQAQDFSHCCFAGDVISIK